jgi:hypothetical protein
MAGHGTYDEPDVYVTRRDFLTRAAIAGGATAAASALPPLLAPLCAARSAVASAGVTFRGSAAPEVVAFFHDQLWLDTSGLSPQYIAPVGARGAASLAALTEHELHTLYGRI